MRDVQAKTKKRIDIGFHWFAVIAVGLLVQCTASQRIYSQDVEVSEIKVDQSDFGDVSSWAVDEKSRRVFAALKKESSILELDILSAEKIYRFRLRKPATQIMASHGFLFCVHDALPVVSLIDLKTNEVVRRITMEGLELPFRLHEVKSKKSEVLLTGLTTNGETAVCRLDGVSGQEKERIVLPERLSDASIAPHGQLMVARDVDNAQSVFDIRWETEQLSPHGKLELEAATLQQFARSKYWLVDPSIGALKDNIRQRRFLNLPKGYLIGDFRSDRAIYAAYKLDPKGLKLLVSNYDSEESEKIELTFEEFSIENLEFHFFGNPREKFLAVSNNHKIQIVNITKLNKLATYIWRSPVFSTYRGDPNQPLAIELEIERFQDLPEQPVWKLLAAPEGTQINENVISIPVDKAVIGNFEIKVGLENADENTEFATSVYIGNPEIEIGFLPRTYTVSPDWKLAAFAGIARSGESELVVFSLEDLKISARIELEELPKILAIGNDEIYSYASGLTVYDRRNFSKQNRSVRLSASFPIVTMSDGTVVYRSGDALMWNNKEDFVAGSRNAVKLKLPNGKLNWERDVFRQSSDYLAGQIVHQDGSNYLRGPDTFSQLNSWSNPVWEHRWNTAIYNGKVFDNYDHRSSSILELPERVGSTNEQLPLAFCEKHSRNDGIEIVGVFRDLIDFEKLYEATIYVGDRPDWYSDYYSRFVKDRQRKPQFIQPKATLLAIGKERAVYLFGSRLIQFPVPNFDLLDFPKPFQLKTSAIEPATWDTPTKFKLFSSGGQLTSSAMVNSIPGITYSTDTNEVEVNARALWQGFVAAEIAAIPESKRSTYRNKRYEIKPEKIDLFKRLYGRPPTGIPYCAMLEFEATNSNGQTTSLTRCVVLDVPEVEYDRLESEFNTAVEEHRVNSFDIAARKYAGGSMMDEINTFLGKSANLKTELTTTFDNEQVDSLIEQSRTRRNVAKVRLWDLKSKISKYEHRLDSKVFENFVKLSESMDQVKSENAALKGNLDAVRKQTIWMLGLASLFYFVALFVLSRSRSDVEES